MKTWTPEELRAKATALRTRADQLTGAASRAADNAPGGFATGRSGRSRAQNRATGRALEKTIDAAVDSIALYREAEQLESRATAIENAPRRAELRARVDAAEKKVKAAAAALPIVNDPAASLHMTGAEWNKMSKDYKAVTARDTYRERTGMRGRGLECVFLTDKPVRARPINHDAVPGGQG